MSDNEDVMTRAATSSDESDDDVPVRTTKRRAAIVSDDEDSDGSAENVQSSDANGETNADSNSANEGTNVDSENVRRYIDLVIWMISVFCLLVLVTSEAYFLMQIELFFKCKFSPVTLLTVFE